MTLLPSMLFILSDLGRKVSMHLRITAQSPSGLYQLPWKTQSFINSRNRSYWEEEFNRLLLLLNSDFISFVTQHTSHFQDLRTTSFDWVSVVECGGDSRCIHMFLFFQLCTVMVEAKKAIAC